MRNAGRPRAWRSSSAVSSSRSSSALPASEDWPRVAQLTQRTNQFNLSLKRRTLEEVKALGAEAIVLVLGARDRFGDYGHVGVCVLRPGARAGPLGARHPADELPRARPRRRGRLSPRHRGAGGRAGRDGLLAPFVPGPATRRSRTSSSEPASTRSQPDLWRLAIASASSAAGPCAVPRLRSGIGLDDRGRTRSRRPSPSLRRSRPSSVVVFDQADIALFSAASHDRNPLHLSEEYARTTPYGQPVVFGILGVLAALGQLPDDPERALVDAHRRVPAAPVRRGSLPDRDGSHGSRHPSTDDLGRRSARHEADGEAGREEPCRRSSRRISRPRPARADRPRAGGDRPGHGRRRVVRSLASLPSRTCSIAGISAGKGSDESSSPHCCGRAISSGWSCRGSGLCSGRSTFVSAPTFRAARRSRTRRRSRGPTRSWSSSRSPRISPRAASRGRRRRCAPSSAGRRRRSLRAPCRRSVRHPTHTAARSPSWSAGAEASAPRSCRHWR